MDKTRITSDALNSAELERIVSSRERGAVVTFSGVVRDREQGAAITAIVYEVYEAMAYKEMAKIIEAVESETGAELCIHHRVGEVPVGEASVVICAASEHRPEAFNACRMAIDKLKVDVPIWKASFIAAVRSPI
ncbi:MAG: hypothetical protein COB53_06680 [Elusimicrobia bacterium]|nr:MAG: hypothetical protein COB53_06680 [Elusimicrobiota bacterium]